MVAPRSQCPSKSATLLAQSCYLDLYKRFKRRLGAHLGDLTAKGVGPYQEASHTLNYLELKVVFLSLKERVPRSLLG